MTLSLCNFNAAMPSKSRDIQGRIVKCFSKSVSPLSDHQPCLDSSTYTLKTYALKMF